MQPRNPHPAVLAVDDEPANLLVIEAVLEPLGYDIRTALDPTAARALMAEERPDVLLLDVMIPGESGIEACRRWRASAEWDGLPIVLLTALRADDHRAAGLAAGADDFLEKPIDVDALGRTVARWAATGRRSGPLPAAGDPASALARAMARAAAQRPRPATNPQ